MIQFKLSINLKIEFTFYKATYQLNKVGLLYYMTVLSNKSIKQGYKTAAAA